MTGQAARYAELRAELASFYSNTEPHSIPAQVHDLAWAHLSCVAANRIAFAAQRTRQPSVFLNPLFQDYLWTAPLNHQFLAMTRLLDSANDVIALPRLLRRLCAAQASMTREAYVTSGGIPYDTDAAAAAIFAAGHRGLKNYDGSWFFFDDPTEISLPDPRASQQRHRRFDVWSARAVEERLPGDLIRPKVFAVLDREIQRLRKSDIKLARDKFIAHAADSGSRSPDSQKRPGPRTGEISLRDLRKDIGPIFALARIFGELLLENDYSGPLGAMPEPEHFSHCLVAAPMSENEAARIGRLPSAMSKIFRGMETHDKLRIEQQFSEPH